MKKVRIILSQEAKEVYEFLNMEAPNSKFERTILNALNTKVDLIEDFYRNPL